MTKTMRYILACVMSLFVAAGCDVHEFPEYNGDPVPFTLHINFDTEMPLYKEVIYTRDGETTKAPHEAHDIRYLIGAYRVNNAREENRVADTVLMFTRPDNTDLNHTVRFELPEGLYDFRVWCDYVDAGRTADKYYNTSDFTEIILLNRNNHKGSNDYRDAFRGTVRGEIVDPQFYRGPVASTFKNEATVEMRRPMGKYRFISTDVELFLDRLVLELKEAGKLNTPAGQPEPSLEELKERIDIGDFKVVLRYNLFMPCSYNMFTDKPADSWTGMSFTSPMYRLSKTEMLLGYDYIFVNGTETTLSISVEVYDKDDTLMSKSNPVNVPVKRSMLTDVRGEFLTSKATGGVAINPGFDGDDYNVPVVFP